jgi:hypothetical protein
MLFTATVRVCPELAPIWKVPLNVPSSSFWPLNWVVSPIRFSSWVSWVTSLWIWRRSSLLFVSLPDWTAS